VVVDAGTENQEWTNLLFKRYNIRRITVTTYHVAANGVIKHHCRPIADALSKLTAFSNKLKKIWSNHLPAVFWTDIITIRCTTKYSPSCLIFCRHAVHLIELENVTLNTASGLQGIDNTPSLIAAGARQLERRREDIDVAMQNLKVSRNANNHCFNQAANLRTEDPQIGNSALVHETKRKQCHDANLDAR
jgi:hypothetical protein